MPQNLHAKLSVQAQKFGVLMKKGFIGCPESVLWEIAFQNIYRLCYIAFQKVLSRKRHFKNILAKYHSIIVYHLDGQVCIKISSYIYKMVNNIIELSAFLPRTGGIDIFLFYR